MALRLLDTATGQRLRGPEVEPWDTISAWLWVVYVLLVTGVLLWWAL